MKVLITGISGFVGSHLAEFLLQKGFEVYGTIRWRSRTENIEHIKKKLRLIYCDIRDASSVEKVIRESMPDFIFLLAAQSYVPASWEIPSETLITNIIGELNVFEAVRHIKISPRILVAGSSEEYGLVYRDELPIRESNPLRPLSPYAVSKVAQDLLGWQYFRSYGLNIIRTRAFNHTGPRRGEVFVTSNVAKQIAMVEAGLQKPVVMVGNLETSRDFTDVRDMVKAYWLALEKGEPGEVYNICSGKAWKIEDIVKTLLSMTNLKIELKLDPLRMRPSDIPMLQGDYSKFHRLTGWRPEIPLEKTLFDLLDYWRRKIEIEKKRD